MSTSPVAPTIGGSFHGAEIHGDAMAGCRLAHRVQVAVLDGHALADVVCVEFLLQRGVEAGAVGAFYPERVARHQGFAEHDEVAVLRCGFVDPCGDLGESRIALEPDRSDLAQRDGERITRDCLSRSSTAT